MNRSLKSLMLMSLITGLYSFNLMASDSSLVAFREGGIREGGQRQSQFHSQSTYQQQGQGQFRGRTENNYHGGAAYERGVQSGESQSGGINVIVVPQNQNYQTDPDFQEPYYPPQ